MGRMKERDIEFRSMRGSTGQEDWDAEMLMYGVDVDKKAAAIEVNCDVVFPADNELQLDLDTPESVQAFEERWDWLYGLLGTSLLDKYEYSTSKSGNTHCTVTLRCIVSDERRLLLQCLLCSDPKREALGFVRLFKLGESRSCLFRPKGK